MRTTTLLYLYSLYGLWHFTSSFLTYVTFLPVMMVYKINRHHTVHQL